MKSKDVLIIGIVVFISGILAFVISDKLITTPADRQQQVDVAPVIGTTFPKPDKTYFNANSIDPTQLIRIGNNSNTAPFNSQASQ